MQAANSPNSYVDAELADPNRVQSKENEVLSAETNKQEMEEPDGGYGWIVVICQLLITMNTWGVNGSFGVYLSHYLSTNSYPDMSEISYSFIGGLSISQITFIAPLVTYVSSKIGTRPTLAIGIVLETGALVSASFVTQGWQLYLTQGFLFGWGCSFLYIGSIGIIPQWFSQRRGIANGIAAAGSGLGGLVYSLASEAIIERLGVSWSFRITAITTASINLASTLLMRNRNHHIKPVEHAFDIGLLKDARLLLIILWGFFSTLGYTLVLFSLPDNAISIGLSSHEGSIIGALVNLGMAIGRPLVGYFSDRIGRTNVIGSATFVAALLCLCLWTSGNTYSVLLAFSILGGMLIGTYWVTVGPLLADTFGTKLLPSTLSIVWTLIVFPTLFAEPIALAFRRPEGSVYLNVQVFGGCMFMGGAICIFALKFGFRGL